MTPTSLSARPLRRIGARLSLALLLGGTAAPALAQNYIGAAAVMAPEYEGADEMHYLPIPLIRYETEHFFLSPRAGLPALGVKWSGEAPITAGLFLSAGLGRDADDARILRGLDDIDDHLVYGAFLAWEPGRFSLSAAYRRAAESGYGAVVDLRAGYRIVQRERDVVTLGANAEWADDDHMQTWFGITPEQSARSEAGLPVYVAGSGVKSAGLSASWLHRFSDSRWALVTAAGASRLLGDARDSPVVERETAPFVSLGLVRMF